MTTTGSLKIKKNEINRNKNRKAFEMCTSHNFLFQLVCFRTRKKKEKKLVVFISEVDYISVENPLVLGERKKKVLSPLKIQQTARFRDQQWQ